jgi:hypothetical protein
MPCFSAARKQAGVPKRPVQFIRLPQQAPLFFEYFPKGSENLHREK